MEIIELTPKSENKSLGIKSSVMLIITLFMLLVVGQGYSLLTTEQNALTQNTSTSLVNQNDSAVYALASNVVSNSDLTTIISLSNQYYTTRDMVTIYIRNTTGISDIEDLSMEISVLEDPTYSFRYLGLLDNKISFMPEKSGTYTIRLYSTKTDNYVYVAEKSFYVYDADVYTCKNYEMNSFVNIDLRSYDYYATRALPNSMTLVYTDEDNNSEVFVYANKIEGIVDYKFTRPGRYALFSEGKYLDCFIANNIISDVANFNTSQILSNTSSNISSNTSSMNSITNATYDKLLGETIGSILYNDSLPSASSNVTSNTEFLSGSRTLIYSNFYSKLESKNFDFSKDKLLDIRGMNNGVLIAEVSRNNIYGVILELWLINVNTGTVKRIALNESAPSSKIRPGIKDNVLFWVSEFNDKVYAYDTTNDLIIYRNLPSYDLGKGEIGRVSFNNTVINSNWDVLVDGSQIYFDNPVEGEVFSDDNSDIKEEFRNKMNLDKYFSIDELSQLSLEVNQEVVANPEEVINLEENITGENIVVQ